jgi:hypothetical protein
VFGDSTTLETTTLPLAVLTASRRQGVSELRIFVAGTADDWDLQSWPIWTRSSELSSRSVGLTLVIPRQTLQSLSWQQSQELASRCSVCSIDLQCIEGEPPKVGALFLAAEVISASNVQRWATTELEDLSFAGSWGGRDAVRRVSATVAGSQPDLELEAASNFDFPKAPPSGYQRVEVTRQLNGSCDGFGERFWRLLEHVSPELSQKLDGSVPLRSVAYSDRYLRSPFLAKLAVDALGALHGRSGGGNGETKFHVVTTPSRADWPGRHMSKDWSSPSEQSDALNEYAARIGGTVQVNSNQNATFHHRNIELEWADESFVEILLDQGFGVLEARPSPPHPFGADGKRQAGSMAEAKFSVSCKTSLPTTIFVGPLKVP